MDLPVNVSTGMVVGRYIADVVDGPDANLDPDARSVQGRIVFTASVPYLPNPTAGPDPVTILRVPIVGVLDQEGYLCTPYPGTLEPQYRGVRLIATDDPDISVTNWTWDVTYIFEPINGHKLAIPAHGFALPSGGTVDLTKVAKVPSSPGYSLPQAEAAALRAEEAALSGAADSLAARQAAERAESAAAATDEGVAGMLSDSGTQSGALLEGLLAPKANSEDVNLALTNKADKQNVDSALAEKADMLVMSEALDAKADLVFGKIPAQQYVDGNYLFPEPLENRLKQDFQPMDLAKREALADQAVAWASSRITNENGDTFPAGLCRRVRLRKVNPTSPIVIDRDTAVEDPNATAASMTLWFLSEYALTFPDKAGTVRPLAEEIGGWLLAMQVTDARSPRYGGIMLGPGDRSCGALTAGHVGEALLVGSKAFGVGEWMGAAVRLGEFCRTLINPNATYQRLYGVDAIDTIDAIIIDAVNASNQAEITATGWNLPVVAFMKKLTDVTGDLTYWADAEPSRDFMAQAVTGHHDFYATKGAASGIGAGLVKTNWSNQSSLDLQDNAWHRQGDAAGGNGTIGTDPQEYGLVALWHTGYDLPALKAAYEWMVSLPNASPETNFGAVYNGRVCLTGYIRVDSPLYAGQSKAFGTYYDSQGAGAWLEWKKTYYPDDYLLSLPIINAVMEPDAGALLDENFKTVWSADVRGAFATQGVIPIMAAAIGLMNTTESMSSEVTE